MRVNVGCGRTPVPGWRNFDNSMSLRLARHPIVTGVLARLNLLNEDQRAFISFARGNGLDFADAQRLPLEDGTVEVLYSSHMFEHLAPAAAARFLEEAARVLQHDGIIRLAVPDLSLLVAEYVQSGDANALIRNMYVCDPLPPTVTRRAVRLAMGQRHHQWMYDGRSLCELLSEHGFRQPEILAPGATRIPNPGGLDLYERASESVYVEARRGPR